VTRALSPARAQPPVDGVSVVSSDALSVLSTRVQDVECLDVPDLREATTLAYVRIGAALGRTGLLPLRIWNYLPDPSQAVAPGLDRYMVFNEGRNSGYRRWFGNAGETAVLPTASAIGSQSGDLVVHCLASPEPGRAIENPRQTSSWRYSQRYGPTPPRFSRATVAAIADQPLILIGGTASILGEDTVHVGDVVRQTHETVRNLAALIAAACGEDDQDDVLDRLQHLRVYVTEAETAATVRAVLASRCPHVPDLEFATTRLCRPELLVEIEGVAALNRQA
jgi:enamine deaminase RidA (YjgF/YER057c/UK114 family)